MRNTTGSVVRILEKTGAAIPAGIGTAFDGRVVAAAVVGGTVVGGGPDRDDPDDGRVSSTTSTIVATAARPTSSQRARPLLRPPGNRRPGPRQARASSDEGLTAQQSSKRPGAGRGRSPVGRLRP